MHEQQVPNFCTNPPAGRAQANEIRKPIWRMKVTAVAPGSNNKLLTCVLCSFEGSIAGTTSFTVMTGRPDHIVGDLIWVFAPGGGTNQTFGSPARAVSWLEIVVWYDIRYNTTTHKIQKTYTHNPVDADWIDITTATPCGTPP